MTLFSPAVTVRLQIAVLGNAVGGHASDWWGTEATLLAR
jgi:hypothetical protein